MIPEKVLLMRSATIIPGLILCLLFVGCEPRQERRLTFAVGGAPAELEFWEELLGEFRRESGIEVELMRQPTDSDQRRQGLVIPLKAGQADPDVFLMDVVWLAQFAASRWLEPLGARMEESGLPEGVFFSRVIETADRHEGELVALPVYVDGGLLYYRRDLLEKYGLPGPPQTWDQLIDYSLEVQAEERNTNPDFFGFVWQGAQYEGLICNFQEIAASGGGGILVRDGEISIDTPPNRRALEFQRDLIHRHRISPPSTYTTMKEEEVREAFQRGNSLFERNWPYAWRLHQGEGSPVRDKVDLAPLPHFPAGTSVSTLGGWHVGISRQSDAKEESWKLLRYVVSYKTQKKLALRLGWNPGRRDLYEDSEMLAELPHFGRLRDVFDHLLPRPVLPYYTQVSSVIQRRLNAALSGQAPPQEALAAAEEQVRQIARRYQPE
ncbi:ABC transporter substrate-binding protein [Desulfuromonas sp. TF]|uniref:ABC transporter substrate-binding protein n=1 Tax=Desulfuromonas sp. TF TaxID=1232410 RepID=UPI000688E6A7|nr:ABC transporter substrate-binding protein [Desulfuromonas sp. TF]